MFFCLHTIGLIYSLPHPLSFSLHLFSAVILGHSLPFCWSVPIRTRNSCIIFKYSCSIPRLSKRPAVNPVPPVHSGPQCSHSLPEFLVLGHTNALCDRTATSSLPFEGLRGGNSEGLVWLSSPPCHCVPRHCSVLIFILRSCWRAGPAASWDGRGRHPGRGVWASPAEQGSCTNPVCGELQSPECSPCYCQRNWSSSVCSRAGSD